MSVVASTKIKTVEGFIPISELVDKEIDVYSMDEDGHLTVATLKNVHQLFACDYDDLISIETTRGILKCSKNQLIYTKNSGYIKAYDLQLTDKVVGLNRKMQGEQKIFVGLTSEKDFRSEHRFIAGFYYDISGKDVHHIDGNHMNNYKSNLEPLDHGIHSRITSWNHPDWTHRDSRGKFTSHKTRKPKDTYRLTENRTGQRFKILQILDIAQNETLFGFQVDKTHNLLADEVIIKDTLYQNF